MNKRIIHFQIFPDQFLYLRISPVAFHNRLAACPSHLKRASAFFSASPIWFE